MKIYINDMSLIWGGDFRLENNLAYGDKGHSSHKKGEDVDISITQLSNNCSGTKLVVLTVELERILDEVFGKNKVWYENIYHWHCTIGPSTFTYPKYADQENVKKILKSLKR